VGFYQNAFTRHTQTHRDAGEALGFQIEQEIPADVLSAFELLVRAGYDKYLIQPQS
jgi:hypothetical protein